MDGTEKHQQTNTTKRFSDVIFCLFVHLKLIRNERHEQQQQQQLHEQQFVSCHTIIYVYK